MKIPHEPKGVNMISDHTEVLQKLYPKDWHEKLQSASLLIERTMEARNITSEDAIKYLMYGQHTTVGFVALRAAQIWIN